MSSPETPATTEETAADEKTKLVLDVKVDQVSACERHVTVTIPRSDIERYFQEAVTKLLPRAEVPGFRPGKAPRQLVESRFQDQVSGQVKSSLLMDSMAQVSTEHDFSAISEPDFDYDAIELPKEGPMKFEFKLEVRPEFDVPVWQGLTLQRPTREFTEADIDHQLVNLLTRHGQLVPIDGPASRDDYVVVNATFTHDGNVLSRLSEEPICVRPILSFRDAVLTDFDTLMVRKEGDKRTAQIAIGGEAENEALRGAKVDVEFQVLDVKKLEPPPLSHQLLERLGGFRSKEELREAIKNELQRQLQYQQHRHLRDQIMKMLTDSAHWDLPAAMLKRQAKRELERAVMELQRSGYSDQEIQAHANALRQRSMASTSRALKEHFILEKIAEQQNIEATDEDYEQEIYLIAIQRHESPRRVQSRMEKRGQMDALRNQIIERKVLQLITDSAIFKDIEFAPEKQETHAVEHAVCGQDETEAIPDAKPDSNPEPLRQPEDHT